MATSAGVLDATGSQITTLCWDAQSCFHAPAARQEDVKRILVEPLTVASVQLSEQAKFTFGMV